MKETSNFPDPLILALETATDVSSVALFSGEKRIACLEYDGLKNHAKMLTPMMDRLLSDLGISPNMLSAVCVGSGPGSYTGLRVGISTAKGLAMALDIPLLAMSSLEAIAWQVQDQATAIDALICPMIDARRMEVFYALYDAQIKELSPAVAYVVEEGSFDEILAERKVIFVGDAAAKCKEVLQKNKNALVFVTQTSTARYMGKAAYQKLQAGQVEDLISFEPFYLKDFIAKLPSNPLIRK